MNILLLGADARTHCLAWKLNQSKNVDRLYSFPGNPGIFSVSEKTDIQDDSFESIYLFCMRKDIDVVVPGPEKYLVEGIYDYLNSKGINVFGPSEEAAKLEGSKAYAKEFMKKYDIPTADFRVFDDYKKMKEYLKKADYPLVIKADGLAAGKGVKVCYEYGEAKSHIKRFKDILSIDCVRGRFVIEEFMLGKEASLLLFVDGENFSQMIYTRDHKRALDNDKGENTGGMGAISNPFINDSIKEYIYQNIVKNTIRGIKEEELEYKGVIYIGIMLDDFKARVVEYNVRFGDPETQVILPLMKNDLGEVIQKTIQKKLDAVELNWYKDEAVCVVLASKGYPAQYEKNKAITIDAEKISSEVFFAGVARSNDQLVTDGGRVISVVGKGKDVSQARKKAYKELSHIEFENKYYRNDIGGNL